MTSAIASRLATLFGLFFCCSAMSMNLSEDPPLFSLDELTPGMQGVGYSVFSSVDGLEPFDFQVLGIMRDFLGPKQDLIIARISGKRFEKATVVAGMSGSPVYIDGRLLGAVSYGFGEFSEHAIAGITPIGDMLNAISVQGKDKIGLSRPVSSSGPVKPIALPLVVRGLAPIVAEYFEPMLKSRGFSALMPSAGQIKGAGVVSEKLFPGGPVAALVVDGDMSLAAIGTVTWVKGDRFLAFGHPFLETGRSELPVANAEIVTTIFSQQMSFKLGQSVKTVGALTDDRNPGIAGLINRTPRTVPMHVTLGAREWNFQIGRQIKNTPMFAAIALGNTLATRSGRELGGTYHMRMTLSLSTKDNVVIERDVAGHGMPMEIAVAFLFLESLTGLVDQELQEVEIDAIDVNLSYSEKISHSNILSADAGTHLTPGRAAKVRVTIKPWQSIAQDRIIDVVIPKGQKAGEYQLIVVDRAGSILFEREAGLRVVPQNLNALIRQIGTSPKDTEICAYLQSPSPSKRVDGYPLVGLPPSLRQLTSGLALAPDATLAKQAVRLSCVDAGSVVSGSVMGAVTVEEATDQLPVATQ